MACNVVALKHSCWDIAQELPPRPAVTVSHPGEGEGGAARVTGEEDFSKAGVRFWVLQKMIF